MYFKKKYFILKCVDNVDIDLFKENNQKNILVKYINIV